MAKREKSVILLYGRRRIGKTALIKEAISKIEDTIIIYHEFHKVTLDQNIAEFSSSIGNGLALPSLPPFQSLIDIFAFLSEIGKKTIVVMDEYSDMKEHAPKGSVDSYMRTIIDNLSNNIKIVITGSALNVMEELLEEDNPLFGRFTTMIKLQALDYFDASKFFPTLPHYNQMEFFSVFGGSPYVLSLLDGSKSLKENIKDTLIKLSGSIQAYIEAVLTLEAGRLPHGLTILTLLSNGKKRYSELEDVIGKDAKGVLAKELKELIELDIIVKTEPINKKDKN